MSKMRTELEDKARREAFVESRLDIMDVPATGNEPQISLRKALKQEYLKQIDDGLSKSNSWIDGDTASFENTIEGIENYLYEYAVGYEAGYKAAFSQN